MDSFHRGTLRPRVTCLNIAQEMPTDLPWPPTTAVEGWRAVATRLPGSRSTLTSTRDAIQYSLEKYLENYHELVMIFLIHAVWFIRDMP